MSVNQWGAVNQWEGTVDIPVFLRSNIPDRVSRIGGVFELDTSFYFDGTLTPFSYSLTGVLPTGLSFNTATGVISGTSTTEESQNISVTATDSNTNTADSNTFEIRSQDTVVIDVTSRGSYSSIYKFLLTQGYEGDINDVLNKWLEDEGHLGAFNDKFYDYLEAQGFSGSLPDMRYSWLKM